MGKTIVLVKMASVTIKKDDLKPYIVANLKHQDGTAVDLSSASGVRFIMKKVGASSAKVDASAAITDASSGEVTYQWQSGDTDTTGVYRAEFEVDWGGGVYQTFPSDDYLEIEIIDDLGGAV